jgi:ACS family hexuronate transporter-like MFS transporter
VDGATARKFGWLVVFMFFAGGILNYIDRAALGVVMPQIRSDLSLTNVGYGVVVNSFLVSYSVFYILGGWLTDRLGLRRSYPLMVILWSIANILHAAAHSMTALCACRALLGIAEGGYFPAAIRGATEWFGSANRGKPIAVYFCASSLGSLFTPPLVAAAAVRFGWRGAFLLTGAIGFVLIPFWFLLHRRIRRAYGKYDPAPAFVHTIDAGATGKRDLHVGEVLRLKRYWLVLASRALCDTVWFFYIFWMPGYFQEALGFSLRRIASLLWIPYLAADASALAGGWLTGVFVKRGRSVGRSRTFVLAGSAVLTFVGSMAGFAPGAVMALVLVSISLAGALSYGSSINTAITDIIPRKHVAVLYGITGAAGTTLAALSQFPIGRLVDSMGYKLAFMGTGAAFAIALALFFAAGRIEPVEG